MGQTFLLLHMVHHIFWQQPASVGRLALAFVCVYSYATCYDIIMQW